ncbi:hypothetical protein NM208_g1723 [Fusarium decemcellulare]|uniref:Uncharacterized protein n=1 Tax=Fusarium decemcellulare TaxID=57161 RepID=A0ACC1SVC5_9HYPO|nr:hypothetical protein NM208_g1723 [Fusarium decemcellulare]
MKFSLALFAIIGLSMAAPAAEVAESQEAAEVTKTDQGFIVDLSAVAAFSSEIGDGKLNARAECPSQQTCIGHRCVMLPFQKEEDFVAFASSLFSPS